MNYKRLRTRALFESPWLTLASHTLGDAQGHPTGREVLSLEMPDWVNVIARTEGGEYVFVRQFRFGTQQDSLEIPGGIVDPGEQPIEAAVRELREETGYVARAWRSLGWCHPNPALQANKLHTFLAEGCVLAGEPALDELEDCRVELVPAAQLRERLARREITHALVLVALLEEALERG